MNQVQLNYNEFVGVLRQQLYRIIPADMEMEVHPVLKNNSLHLDSLVLSSRECSASPNFYLQDYYKSYQRGGEIAALAEDIYCRWQEMADRSGEPALSLAYDSCRNYVVYRLVNAARNQELLEESPYIPFLDLAIVFYYLVSSQEDGIRSIRINNQLMEQWKADTQTLLELAGRNTPRLFPAKYCPISDLLGEFLQELPGERELYQMENEPHILTNNKGINGAAVWLYPDQMEWIARKKQKGFYILPSSIHELLVLTEDGQMREPEMLRMVRQVNRECVGEEEFLSDNIYYYDPEQKAMRMISE